MAETLTVARGTGLRSTVADGSAWWRLWALAALVHVITNGRDGLDASNLVNLGVGAVALLVCVDPARGRWRVALSAGIVVSAFVESPVLGNHWLLAALVSVIAVVHRPDREGWFERAAPDLRLGLLVFYSFAAFAKLNSGFLDTTTSCARVFSNQVLEFWGLPTLGAGSAGATLVIVATVAIELSVPFLLVVRRTRRAGVVLAGLFHLLLTADLVQHFADFTLVLLPLFLCFGASGTLTSFDGRWTAPLRRRAQPIVGFAAVLVVVGALPLVEAVRLTARAGFWLGWVVLGPWLAWCWVRSRPDTGALVWRPSVGAVPVLAVMVLIGLSPYLGLRTATAYNMYSNLVVAGGDTNHLVVPMSAGLNPNTDDLVVIVESDDEDLAEYIDSGFALPMVNLAAYLDEHPESRVKFELDGRVEVYGPGDRGPVPEFGWTDRLGRFVVPLRSVPTGEPSACQPVWLAAE